MNARALFPAVTRRYRLLRRPTESILPASPRPMRRDCHGRLLAALIERAGPGGDVADSGITAWASATFVGARHTVSLTLAGEDAEGRAEALALALPEAEFSLPGHIVADLSVDAVEARTDGATISLSILTIEAW
jgi:hypothetical protein